MDTEKQTLSAWLQCDLPANPGYLQAQGPNLKAEAVQESSEVDTGSAANWKQRVSGICRNYVFTTQKSRNSIKASLRRKKEAFSERTSAEL
jgi:hypothetical protein